MKLCGSVVEYITYYTYHTVVQSGGSGYPF